MQCKVCGGPATGICRSCDGPYCAQHGGGVLPGWTTCAECFAKIHPKLAFAAIFATGLGVLTLLVARWVGFWSFAILAPWFFGVAAWLLYGATRPNPWADRTGDE
jgi:hypothetical protein